ncbi:MAG: DUF2934 domain-containing protein [Pseudomonas sp.]
MSIDEGRIREFAYQIWEAEGKPQGQEERHWAMASKLAEAEAQSEAQPLTRSRQISKPRAVTLAEVEAEADKPELLKKPRARSATPKKPKA